MMTVPRPLKPERRAVMSDPGTGSATAGRCRLSHLKDSKPLPRGEVRRNDDGSIDMVFYRRLAHRLRQEAMIQFVLRMRESSLARLRGLRRILSKSRVMP